MSNPSFLSYFTLSPLLTRSKHLINITLSIILSPLTGTLTLLIASAVLFTKGFNLIKSQLARFRSIPRVQLIQEKRAISHFLSDNVANSFLFIKEHTRSSNAAYVKIDTCMSSLKQVLTELQSPNLKNLAQFNKLSKEAYSFKKTMVYELLLSINETGFSSVNAQKNSHLYDAYLVILKTLDPVEFSFARNLYITLINSIKDNLIYKNTQISSSSLENKNIFDNIKIRALEIQKEFDKFKNLSSKTLDLNIIITVQDQINCLNQFIQENNILLSAQQLNIVSQAMLGVILCSKKDLIELPSSNALNFTMEDVKTIFKQSESFLISVTSLVTMFIAISLSALILLPIIVILGGVYLLTLPMSNILHVKDEKISLKIESLNRLASQLTAIINISNTNNETKNTIFNNQLKEHLNALNTLLLDLKSKKTIRQFHEYSQKIDTLIKKITILVTPRMELLASFLTPIENIIILMPKKDKVNLCNEYIKLLNILATFSKEPKNIVLARNKIKAQRDGFFLSETSVASSSLNENPPIIPSYQYTKDKEILSFLKERSQELYKDLQELPLDLKTKEEAITTLSSLNDATQTNDVEKGKNKLNEANELVFKLQTSVFNHISVKPF